MNANPKSSAAATDRLRSLSPATRKQALLERVKPIVDRYARVHSIPPRYCEPATINLANHDLALIPLLHDPGALKAKIEEVVSILRDDTRLPGDVDLAPADTPVLNATSSIELVRQQAMTQDPSTSEASSSCELGPAQPHHTLRAKNASEIEDWRESEYENGTTDSTVSSRPPINAAPLPLQGELDLVESLDKLVLLPSRAILNILQGDRGDHMLCKLGLGLPNTKEKSWVDNWTQRTMSEQGLPRKLEIASVLAKKLQVCLSLIERLR